MKASKDKFSTQSDAYKKFRPTYPDELYEVILSTVKSRNECWDCGTGNGQVAVELSKHFKKVYATDLSQNQIDNAEKRENILYAVGTAEKTGFDDNKFDLVTVAQAAHWFHIDAFNKEVRRVCKNGGIVCVWGYGLLRINDPINKLIDEFYNDIIGPYWDPERRHIENGYNSLNFDFSELDTPKNLFIRTQWTLPEFEGYLNSWSSVQNYKELKKENPVTWMMDNLKKLWGENVQKEVRFPIFMKMGVVRK